MKSAQKKKRDSIDKFFKYLFATFAFLAVVLLALITIFIVFKGVKPLLPGNEFGTINLFNFLTGDVWNPSQQIFGIGYMIIGTILSMLIAIIIAVPIAILASVTIAEMIPKKAAGYITTAVELLAGIPSVIYGIFGLGLIVPLVKMIPSNTFPQGNSLLATGIVLAVMILPTIIAISVTSIKAVPKYYKEAFSAIQAKKNLTKPKSWCTIYTSG